MENRVDFRGGLTNAGTRPQKANGPKMWKVGDDVFSNEIMNNINNPTHSHKHILIPTLLMVQKSLTDGLFLTT